MTAVDDKVKQAVPGHLAIIMDGNGRWAQSKGLERRDGHREGAANVLRICKACQDRGITTLSLFAFSTENWSRPKGEIDALFDIAKDYFTNYFVKFPQMGIRLNVIGSREKLPQAMKTMISMSEKANPTKYTLTVNIAANYGGRWDIAQAARKLAEKCVSGQIKPSEIDETALEAELRTADQPPVDLLVRTSGEQRISNFMIWQCAYSEFYFTKKHWPEFDDKELDTAILEYANRTRKFGGLA